MNINLSRSEVVLQQVPRSRVGSGAIWLWFIDTRFPWTRPEARIIVSIMECVDATDWPHVLANTISNARATSVQRKYTLEPRDVEWTGTRGPRQSPSGEDCEADAHRVRGGDDKGDRAYQSVLGGEGVDGVVCVFS